MSSPPLLAIILMIFFLSGCVQQQQASNNFCTSLNATIDIKPRTDLALLFGNDAIRTAIEAIHRQVLSQPNTPQESLVRTGQTAGIEKAESDGKRLSDHDKSSLESYLRESVVPTVVQNPTCIFNVSASTKPYIGIESVSLGSGGQDQVVRVKVRNSGQTEANPVRLVVKNIVGGKEYSKAEGKLTLGPGQSREVSDAIAKLPIAEIIEGKLTLDVDIELSYLNGVGTAPIIHREVLHFRPADKSFGFIASN